MSKHRAPQSNRRPIALFLAALAVTVGLGATVAEAATTKRVSSTYAADAAPVLHLAGAIRCSGGVYSAIADGGHSPYGIASVTTTSTYVRVTYSQPLTHVGSFMASPDETYAQADVDMGASVGLTYVDVKFAQGGQPVSPASVCLAWSNVWLTGYGHLS